MHAYLYSRLPFLGPFCPMRFPPNPAPSLAATKVAPWRECCSPPAPSLSGPTVEYFHIRANAY